MLVLTEAAAEVVKSVTATPQAPDGTGLRISQSIPQQGGPEQSSGNALQLAAAAGPDANDQVVEASGARVFLDQEAAAYLDDKVLDAEVDAQGKVRFTLGQQDLRGE
jgi:iron-sulfur cluster assembly protein